MPGQVMNADTAECLKIVLPEAFLRNQVRQALALVPDLPVEIGVRRIDFGTENDLVLACYIKKFIKLDIELRVQLRLAGPRTVRITAQEAEVSGFSVRGLLDKVAEQFPGMVRIVGEAVYEYDVQYPFIKLTSARTDGENLVVFGDLLQSELMQFLATLPKPTPV